MRLILFGFWTLGCASTITPPGPQPPLEAETTAKAEPHSLLLRLGGTAEVETQKNGTTIVGAVVEGLEGELHVRDIETWEGLQGAVRVPIAAFNTGLELRDERIQEVFFNRETWPNAVVEFSAPEGFGDALTIGGTRTIDLPAQISIGGGTAALKLTLAVTRDGSRKYSVSSESPVSLSIQGLGLSDALARLVELCGHQSVRDEVKVSVTASITD